MDSFDKVYSKITSNGIIVVDDCGLYTCWCKTSVYTFFIK